MSNIKSPDGAWKVLVEKEEHGGLGTAGTILSVRLIKTSSEEPINILVFEDDGNGAAKVRAEWQGNRKLRVMYSGALVDFQAIFAGGIQIQTQAGVFT